MPRAYDSAEYKRNRKRLLAPGPSCVVCGKLAREADHIIPRAWYEERGLPVDNSLSNLQPMCKPHNASKSDRRITRYRSPNV